MSIRYICDAFGCDMIYWQQNCFITSFNTLDHLFCVFQFVVFNQRFSNWLTHSFQECVSHRTTDHKTINHVHETFDDCDLVRNFRTTHHSDVRAFWILQKRIQHVDFFFDQETNAFVFHH
ncbi:hypothetical protein D3C87_1499380 [compost metagenome]